MYTNINLHAHTDASLNDGAMTVKQYVAKVKEIGATAAAITDHGGCWNWLDFFNAAKDSEIKPILGVEAYMNIEMPITENFSIKKRPHLLLLAKNYAGMQEISRFVSETNRHFISGKPTGDLNMLSKFFRGTNNVIATSACIGGVLATPLSFNLFIDREIEKISNRIEASKSNLSDGLGKALKENFVAEKKISELTQRISELEPIGSKVLTTKKFLKEQISDAEQLALAYESLEVEKFQKKQANEEIKALKAEITKIRTSNKANKDLIRKNETKLETIKKNKQEISSLEAAKRSEKSIYEITKKYAKEYKAIFGKNFYCEIQYHGIEKEALIYPQIVRLAREINIPLVATNDCHMANKEDSTRRQLLQNMAVISQKDRGWREAITGDDELYIKTGDELAKMLSQIYPEDVVSEAMTNIEVIADQCNLELSTAKHYPKFDNARDRLRSLCEKGIPERYPDGFPESYRERMEYELGIIDQMGFNDYFCEVADFIQFSKSHGDNSIENGPGRGSGGGSIVCYLTKIIEIDPMKYNLLFERFLNPHRVSMPDIDTDFSGHARKLTIAYVKEKYGERAVASIMTKGCIAAKSALEYSYKLLGLKEDNDRKKYTATYKAIRKYIGDEPNAKLADYEKELREDFKADEKAITILNYAMMIEGFITSYGTHAAGVIISDGTDIENYIPLMKSEDDDGNEVFAVQADMVQCEAQLGFIKMDFLGLKNLNAITDAMHIITERYGCRIDPYNLPFEPEIFTEIYAKGDTNFVFQVESDGMKGMLSQLNPTCFEDIILAISVYRPGPMEFIPDIIRCKNTGAKSSIVEKFPMLEETLRETYGYPVYQEQVMAIMTICAGFDMGHADSVRRYMSKKKELKLAKEKPNFIEGCKTTNNIPEEDADWLFEQLMPFAKYGFNKSHATAYALVSYITAWLKYHYRIEYLCAIMKTQPEKTAQFSADCKASDITIYRPDINNSHADYYPYKDGIIIGFRAIKGLKSAADVIVFEREQAGQPFDSIESIVEKTAIGASHLAKLINAGACDDFTVNRETASTEVVEYSDLWKKVKTRLDKLKELNAQTSLTEKEEKARLVAIASKNAEITSLRNEMRTVIKKHVVPLSTEKRLLLEVEALGMWVTGNPLEDYDTKDLDTLDGISEKTDGTKLKMAAVITEDKVIKTKKGDRMAFLTITDKNGESISAVCFPKTFEKYQDNIQSGSIIKIDGHKDSDNNDEPQIVIDDIALLDKEAKVILVVAPTIEDMSTVYNFACGYMCENLADGMFMKIYTQEMSDISQTTFTVSPDVVGRLTENNYSVKITAM